MMDRGILSCLIVIILSVDFAAVVKVEKEPKDKSISAISNKSADYRAACAKTFKINVETLGQDNPTTMAKIDSTTYKKYLFCVWKKMGYMNAKGEVQKDALRQSYLEYSKASPINAQWVDAMIKECTVQKSIPRDTAYNLYICSEDFAKSH